MIGPKGSLSINLPADEVSWYRFLAASRLATSPHGGWNSKSYWNDLGVSRLSRDIVQDWTKNSLAKRADPSPRKACFKLLREMSKSRLELADQKGNRSENRLNVTLFNKYSASEGPLFLREIRFFGYEIPLSDTKSQMLRIDLLGEIQNQELALVELKKSKGSDSPLMAFTEAVCYALQLIRCKKTLIPELEKQIGVHWDGQRPIHLIIAAPKPYWEYWTGKIEDGEWLDRLSGTLQSFVYSINEVLDEQKEPTLTLKLEGLPEPDQLAYRDR